MPLNDLIASRNQQQQQEEVARAESRRQTRIGRYRERFEQAFGDNSIEEFSVAIDAPGTAEPAVAAGTIEHEGKQHVLVCVKHENGGYWWVLDDKPLFRHLGSSSNVVTNKNRLIDAVMTPSSVSAPPTDEM